MLGICVLYGMFVILLLPAPPLRCFWTNLQSLLFLLLVCCSYGRDGAEVISSSLWTPVEFDGVLEHQMVSIEFRAT